MAQNRRKGPIGGLFGLVGSGIGMASEYHEHRKEQKKTRTASQQQNEPTDGDPSQTQAEHSRVEQPDAPPAYDDSPAPKNTRLSDKKDPALFKNQEDDSDSSDSDSVADDSEEWELDDALAPTDSRGLPTYEESEAANENETMDDWVQDVVGPKRPTLKTTPSGNAFVRQPLPVPVILPQRRPRKKARGFIRAYAPVLDNCGIDQDTFLRFLKNFHKSSQASPIFPIIKLAAGIAGTAPSVIAMAVCTAAQVAAGIGEEVQSRARTNNFLDRMNEELFKPAGLYAMIVKYKSDADVEVAANRRGVVGGLASAVKSEQVDFSTNQVIAKYNRAPSDEGDERTMKDRMKGLRLASDTTHGSIELPESAPLIFPEIDHKMATEGPESFKDKTKDAKKFLADYFDRRAQVKYASQDPRSSLAVPEEQRTFKSGIADPNHPMHSGGLVALLSGGKVAPRLAKRERKREKRLAKDVRRVERGRDPRDRKRYGDDYYEEVAARSEGGRLGVGVDPTQHSPALAGRSFGSSSAPMANPPSIGEKENVYSARRGVEDGTPRYVYDRTARRGGHKRRKRPDGVSNVKRIMREDVLYLLIVNMPSEEELAKAREELAAAR